MKKIFALILLLTLPACSYAEDYVPGDVIVLLRNTSGTSIGSAVKSSGGVKGLSSVQAFAESSNVNVTKTFDALSSVGGDIFMVVHSDKEDAKSLLRKISANPNVIAASLNRIYHGYDESSGRVTPNDPEYYRLWGMEAVHAPYAWNISTGSNDVYVAVIDSGIDYDHPDLQAQFVHEYSKNFVEGAKYDDKSYYDEVNHGTHIAGTIGAVGNNGIGVAGLNWNVKIFSVRVLDAYNSGSSAAIISGINHVVQVLNDNKNMKLAAVNFSIGGARSFSPESAEGMTDLERLALKNLSDTNRTLICVAAGNETTEVGAPNYYGDFSSMPQGDYVYPASHRGIDNMIVTAAADPDLLRSSFSNYSPNYVDIAAPGESIFSTLARNNRIDLKYDSIQRNYPYGLMGGTSMAAPHVSGTAALLAAMFPNATPSQIKAAIIGGADRRVLCGDRTSMYGMLDIEQAIYVLSRIMSTNASPLIAFANPHEGIVNQPYNFRLYASGSGPITWTLEGALPEGLSFSSGTITGTPSSAGRKTVVITAENDYGQDSAALTISTVKGTAPKIRDTFLPAGVANSRTSQYIRLDAGTWPFAWEIANKAEITADGSLISIDKTGLLQFIPKNAKQYNVIVKASNAAGEDRADLAMNVNSSESAPEIYSKTLKRAVAGRRYGVSVSSDFPAAYNVNPNSMNYGDTIFIDSGTRYIWSADNLPAGMYCYNSEFGVRLDGYPRSADTYTFTMTVSNDYAKASRDFTIIVENAAPSFLSPKYDLIYARGMNMDLRIPVLGTPHISLGVSGTLPESVNFVSEDYTAVFSGIPSKNGTYTATVTASNQYGSASAEVTLTITDPAIITTAVLPDAVTGESYSFKFTSLYDVGLSWSERGDVLSGLGLNISSSGEITGTPTKAGDYRFTVNASALDGSGLGDTWSFLLRVNEKASITTTSLPSGTINTPYDPVYLAYNGTSPVRWTLSGGAMPAGLGLTSNGCIHGTPTESGDFTFSLEAENSAGSDARSFTLKIGADSSTPGSGTESGDSKADPRPAPDPSSSDTEPVITQGGSRGVSSLLLRERVEISEAHEIIAAVLPSVSVNISGVYTFESVDAFAGVMLSSDVPAGYTLMWHPFTRNVSGSSAEGADDDSDLATFYDTYGDITETVPANHIVNISAYLEAGKTYYPVVSVADKSTPGISSSSGGCESGLSVLSLMFCAVIFRKISR